ncbi:MAG: hypothetical protein K0R09_3615 [Clostridiales bacterium]|nr:hypothetical protein [Clostridiales bacterium]
MKKTISIIAALCLAAFTTTYSIYRHENKIGTTLSSLNSVNISSDSINSENSNNTTATSSDFNAMISDAAADQSQPIQETIIDGSKTEIVQAPKQSSSISRGGTPPSNTQLNNSGETSSSTVKQESKNVELLDWWKQGKSAFPVGTVAEVKDVQTGKTFKIKRTMGTNHADCEALTIEDTNIIKSIWGGFTWDIRPIHIIVDDRTLAASMAAMPHAGIDSAPAYAVINNRSQGYGRGENLDVVKNNGMDGHFDIHFLNSTRHKDGKIDSRHQAAIKIAANK